MSAPDNHDAELDLLVEAVFQEVDAMETDFNSWLNREALRWQELGRDETWIRLRLELAQTTRTLNRQMKSRSFTEAQRRAAIRLAFTKEPSDLPEQAYTPPEEIAQAMAVLGQNMSAAIFEVTPTLTQEQLVIQVELLIEHELGVSLAAIPSSRVRLVREQLVAVAIQEYDRLGGVLLQPHRHGKPKRQHPKRH